MHRAETEFQDGGNTLVAAEFLWGALAHALIAFALDAGLQYDSHGALRHVARELARSQRRERWRSDFGAGEQLHIHFYHSHLESGTLDTRRRETEKATEDLLNMLRPNS